jgi:peptidoglycan/LPS O-acetylase OafA/YrhL
MVENVVVRGRPPAPVRAVRVILVVVSSLLLLLFLAELVGGVWESDPGGQRSSAEGAELSLGLFGLWTARAVGRGRRGGLVLATLAGLAFLCSGNSLIQLPPPVDLVALVPFLAGVAVLVLLLVPAQSREWFKPARWASTR